MMAMCMKRKIAKLWIRCNTRNKKRFKKGNSIANVDRGFQINMTTTKGISSSTNQKNHASADTLETGMLNQHGV